MDIDFYLKKTNLQKEIIIDAIKEISSIDNGDDIHFQIVDINNIREQDQYGGFQITLIGNWKMFGVNLE